MQRSPDTRYDVASAISQGRRPYQEDAIVTDFPMGADLGFAVLADGMGGHAAGDVASKIVVTEVFSELKLQSGNRKKFATNLPAILRGAAMAANDCVKGHVTTHRETAGMGATLVAPVFMRNKLWWISVGDSPLYLFRKGKLIQLNEDHSMAPQIDFMIRSGMMAEDIGRNHPDRSALTSVLGGEQVSRIDCPTEPVELEDQDVVLVASDGLQYLTEDEISEALSANIDRHSMDIAGVLLEMLEDQQDPEQDNASFSVIKIGLSYTSIGRRILNGTRGARKSSTAEVGQKTDVIAANSGDRAKPSILARGSALFRGSTS